MDIFYDQNAMALNPRAMNEYFRRALYGDMNAPARRTHHANHGTHVHIGFDTNENKETAMDRNAVITSELARLQEELANRERFGADTHDDGTVIRFSGDYAKGPDSKKYVWVALKVNGRWLLTGRETASYSWSQLVDTFISANVKKVHLMVKGERIA